MTLSHVEQELLTLTEHYSRFKSNMTVITCRAGTSHPYGTLLKLQGNMTGITCEAGTFHPYGALLKRQE
jgi:hypothetical protein